MYIFDMYIFDIYIFDMYIFYIRKNTWRTFNLFIYFPETRYKSESTILLRDDEDRSGPFNAVNFSQYTYGD